VDATPGVTYDATAQTFTVAIKSATDILSFTQKDLSLANSKLYGDTTNQLALRSVKAWGPMLVDAKIILSILGRNGSADQLVEDTGTPFSRPKVGLRVPQLSWLRSSSTDDSVLFKLIFKQATGPTLGSIDVSWVARRSA
jgi:hypothetical protein